MLALVLINTNPAGKVVEMKTCRCSLQPIFPEDSARMRSGGGMDVNQFWEGLRAGEERAGRVEGRKKICSESYSSISLCSLRVT